jgi:glutaredoxin 2
LIDETYGDTIILKPFSQREELKKWSETSNEVFFKLLLPRLHQAHLPEFTLKEARDHFEKKMSTRLGNFKDLIDQTPELLVKANLFLQELEPLFASSEAINEEGFGYDDIDFFSRIRNFTLVKDLVWPPKLRAYIDHIAQQTDIKLLDDLAKF